MVNTMHSFQAAVSRQNSNNVSCPPVTSTSRTRLPWPSASVQDISPGQLSGWMTTVKATSSAAQSSWAWAKEVPRHNRDNSKIRWCMKARYGRVPLLNLPRTQTHHPMGHDHDHHDHAEAEQNEIGGPVVFALMLLAVVVTVIYFLS